MRNHIRTSDPATFFLTYIAVLAALILICPEAVLGDGGFVAPRWSFMYEPEQQAFINFDHDSGREQLSIQPGFIGDARAFAWIVPVPSLPEVALADPGLFPDLDTLTRPIYRSRDGDWDCFMDQRVTSADEAAGGFEVLDSRVVGYYQTMTLAATEAPALLEFLTALGFLHDDNRVAATAAISDYVDRSWYFVTMQVDSTALAEIHGHYIGPYWGRLDPIQLTFDSAEIIYPMKISAISAADDSQVHLFVNADHRMTFPGADTYYANRFISEELNKVARFRSLQAAFQPGDFLTKLHRGYRPDQMTEDIVLEQAANDDEFLLINYGGFPWTGALLLALPLAVAFKRRFWVGTG